MSYRVESGDDGRVPPVHCGWKGRQLVPPLPVAATRPSLSATVYGWGLYYIYHYYSNSPAVYIILELNKGCERVQQYRMMIAGLSAVHPGGSQKQVHNA